MMSLLMLFACSDKGSMEKPQESGVQEAHGKIVTLDVGAMENEAGQIVFNVSIDDFMESFNSIYRSNGNGEDFLPPLHEWPFYNTMAIHADNEVLCHHYSEDESIRAIPKISVFTPVTDDAVQQVIVSYDDHSYSIPTYEMYEELCFYTMKTMLPDMTDDEITALCSRVNTMADENITDVPYSSKAAPCALYHKGGIGIYPYYCIGEELRFCIIPVTEKALQEFRERGTDIIALQNE